MGEYFLQTVPRISHADPTSNSVESDSGRVDTVDTKPLSYTMPEGKKDHTECIAIDYAKREEWGGSAYE